MSSSEFLGDGKDEPIWVYVCCWIIAPNPKVAPRRPTPAPDKIKTPRDAERAYLAAKTARIQAHNEMPPGHPVTQELLAVEKRLYRVWRSMVANPNLARGPLFDK